MHIHSNLPVDTILITTYSKLNCIDPARESSVSTGCAYAPRYIYIYDVYIDFVYSAGWLTLLLTMGHRTMLHTSVKFSPSKSPVVISNIGKALQCWRTSPWELPELNHTLKNLGHNWSYSCSDLWLVVSLARVLCDMGELRCAVIAGSPSTPSYNQAIKDPWVSRARLIGPLNTRCSHRPCFMPKRPSKKHTYAYPQSPPAKSRCRKGKRSH